MSVTRLFFILHSHMNPETIWLHEVSLIALSAVFVQDSFQSLECGNLH